MTSGKVTRWREGKRNRCADFIFRYRIQNILLEISYVSLLKSQMTNTLPQTLGSRIQSVQLKQKKEQEMNLSVKIHIASWMKYKSEVIFLQICIVSFAYTVTLFRTNYKYNRKNTPTASSKEKRSQKATLKPQR